MAQGVVFKQSYKSRNLPSTPTLNVKHLDYIATRKGTVRNPGCGFGLWGSLQPHAPGENIDDLREAKAVVRTASKEHTIYRAILSIDNETAHKYGLYRRQPWQELVTQKVNTFAEEWDIDRKDFRWVASMHYAKGHPHVHIMYWDASSKVHQEGMGKEKFSIFAAKVRTEFGREVYREDLIPLHVESRAVTQELRKELKAMMLDANIAQAMNLTHVSDAKLDSLGKQFIELLHFLPTKGGWDYQYLLKKAGPQLNTFLDECLKIPDFIRVHKKYEQLTEEINQMYGNGQKEQDPYWNEEPSDQIIEMEGDPEKEMEYYRNLAKNKLYKNLGNELVKAMRAYRDDLEANAPTDDIELQNVIRSGIGKMLLANNHYQSLLQQMPKLRTPMQVLTKDSAFFEEKQQLVKELCLDLRIRTQVKGYIKAATTGLSQDEAFDFGKKAFQQLFRAADQIVRERLETDAGYPAQERIGLMTDVLLRLFGTASRGAGQMQSQRDLLRHRRDMSKAAQKDRQKQREHESGWTFEP